MSLSMADVSLPHLPRDLTFASPPLDGAWTIMVSRWTAAPVCPRFCEFEVQSLALALSGFEAADATISMEASHSTERPATGVLTLSLSRIDGQTGAIAIAFGAAPEIGGAPFRRPFKDYRWNASQPRSGGLYAASWDECWAIACGLVAQLRPASVRLLADAARDSASSFIVSNAAAIAAAARAFDADTVCVNVYLPPWKGRPPDGLLNLFFVKDAQEVFATAVGFGVARRRGTSRTRTFDPAMQLRDPVDHLSACPWAATAQDCWDIAVGALALARPRHLKLSFGA
jgi:hypothetical protein